MKILVKTVDNLQGELIEFEHVVSLEIEGFKIGKTENGISISVNHQLVVLPKASNYVNIESKDY